MMQPGGKAEDYFCPDYFTARDLLQLICARRALDIESYICPAPGPDGQQLTTNVVRIGSLSARKVLLIVSGTHGLEALTGAACQVDWLANFHPQSLPEDLAVVMVHILNPWGCAWRRRQTEDNIDLNRNFLGFSQTLPSNPFYEDLKKYLRCPELKGALKEAALAQIQQYKLDKGQRAYATALFQGQYSDPSGIGFGGQKAAWSNEVFGKITSRYATHAEKAGLIDIHAGLGRYGHGMLIATSASGSKGLALAKAWYGEDIVAMRERPEDMPYEVHGDLCGAVERLLPDAAVVPIALEYGTYEIDRLLGLQIDDCWLVNYGDAHPPLGQSIRTTLQDFFYPEDPVWRSMVISRFNEVITRASEGLCTL